jgi:hypothetical protein
MRPYLITAKLMRPSNMKRFPTPGLIHYPARYYLSGLKWHAGHRFMTLQRRICSFHLNTDITKYAAQRLLMVLRSVFKTHMYVKLRSKYSRSTSACWNIVQGGGARRLLIGGKRARTTQQTKRSWR